LTQKRFPKKGKRSWQIKEKKVRKEKIPKNQNHPALIGMKRKKERYLMKNTK